MQPKVIDEAEVDRRFDYHAPDEEKRLRHEDVRRGFKTLSYELIDALPESREKSLAFTALEEAMFWANASIAREESA